MGQLVRNKSVNSSADGVMQQREQRAVAQRWREVWRRGFSALLAVQRSGLLNHSVGSVGGVSSVVMPS